MGRSALVVRGRERNPDRSSQELLLGDGFDRVAEVTRDKLATELRLGGYDLVVDTTSEGHDGGNTGLCRACQALRAATSVPVLVVSNASDGCGEADALRSGADAYVERPLRPDLFRSTVAALMRRLPADPTKVPRPVRTYNVAIDPNAKRVTVDSREVDVTRIELAILSRLVETPDWIVARGDLLSSVWGDNFYDDHIVQVNISRLRRKMQDAGADPRFLSTHRGLGYRINTVGSAMEDLRMSPASGSSFPWPEGGSGEEPPPSKRPKAKAPASEQGQGDRARELSVHPPKANAPAPSEERGAGDPPDPAPGAEPGGGRRAG